MKGNILRGLTLLLAVALPVAMFIAVWNASHSAVNSFKSNASIISSSNFLEVKKQIGKLTPDDLTVLGKQFHKEFSLAPYVEVAAAFPSVRRSKSVTVLGVSGGELLKDIKGEYFGADSAFFELAVGGSSPDLQNPLSVPLIFNDKHLSVTVTKKIESPGVASKGAFLVSDISIVDDLFSLDGQASGLILVPKKETSIETLQTQVALALTGTPYKLATAQEESSNGVKLLAAFTNNIWVMILITALISTLTIFAAAQISLKRISSEIDLLKLLGVSRLQCISFLLLENILFGVLGSLVGIVAGKPLSEFISLVLLTTTAEMYQVQTKNTANDLFSYVSILAFLLGVGICAIGSVRPIMVLTGGSLLKPKNQSALGKNFILIALLVGCLGFAALAYEIRSLMIAYLAILLLMLFLVLATQLILRSMTSVFRSVFIKKMSVESFLAFGEIESSIKHSGLSVAITTASLTMLIGLGLMIHSFRVTLKNWTDTNFSADLFIKPDSLGSLELPARISPEVEARIQTIVGPAVLYRTKSFTTTIETFPMTIVGTDFTIARERNTLEILSGSITDSGILISESTAEKLGHGVGSQITLFGEPRTVSGIYKEFARDRGTVLVSLKAFENLIPGNGIDGISIFLKDPSTIQEYQTTLLADLKDSALVVTNNKQLRTTIEKLFNQTFAITKIIQIIVALMCVSGFAVTIFQLLIERTKNIRMIYELGVSPPQYGLSLGLESAVLLGSSALVGTLGGVALAALLIFEVNPIAFGWTLHFYVNPWELFFPNFLLITANVMASILIGTLAFRTIKVHSVAALLLLTVCLCPGLASSQDYQTATREYKLEFPHDHGAHDKFQTEWWYYTGQLYRSDHKPFVDSSDYGFQLTFFRRRLNTKVKGSWNQGYLSHAAIADFTQGTYTFQTLRNRSGLGIAGAKESGLEVWNEDWKVISDGEKQILSFNLDGGITAHLVAVPETAPVPQGKDGFSIKGFCADCASMYYSFPKLKLSGELTLPDKTVVPVTGMSWMDHEFMTNALQKDQTGWDWFSLNIGPDRQVMLFRMRSVESGKSFYIGKLVENGSVSDLNANEFSISETKWWKSDKSGGNYPIDWHIQIPKLKLDTEIHARMKNQEIADEDAYDFAYWEGAVSNTDNSVIGYVELTGYAKKLGGF